ncbi:MAG: polysaccharide deacetylase family protein [Candidatus Eremiobacteraeota bacterium]|nr:polysaccharide deacetylase family protein [Candidatus Eremiobacteraeota bacterium]
MPRPAALAAAALAAALALYAGRRLWLKSDDLLRPAVVLRGQDARALLQPSLGARLAALVRRAVPPDARPRLVALTFDDGPYPVTTPLLLQRLRDVRVRATFFLIGRDAEQFPGLARAVAADGHELANHTLTHPDLDGLDDAAVRAELAGGAAALGRIAPDPAERRLFRPPHGRYRLATVLVAQRAGYDTVLWNDDPGDWRSVPAAALRDHLLARATAPEIVLLHSGRPATIAALPDVVARYRAAGFAFVTVGELLRRCSIEALDRPAKISLASGVGRN